MPTFVDHIIIAVSDLETATQDYALMLGRDPSWRGRHPDYGSANTLFVLDNTYLELLAAEGSGWAGDRVTQHIADKGQGLMGLVFGVEEVEPFINHARQAGLDISDPLTGHGTDLAETAERSWQNMVWPEDAARGIFSFAIRHDDPDALKIAPIAGAGPCTEVDHVVVQTSDTKASKNFYGTQLGIRLALEQSRPDWGGDMLFFRTNHMSIEVIGAPKFDAQLDHLWGLALKTDDIEATHARLVESNVAVSEVREGRKAGTRVCTVKSHCLDVPTLLVQHLSS
jgi:catechol 2,3-dioxygenase-like lactoylglutathione lyase family enzyme